MIKKEYPEEGELVIGTVIKVQNFGAFITLDEYPGKEGFIHIAEIATGWVKRIRNHIKEKQKVVCKVLNVDTYKQHIDLSLKRVNDHQKRDKIQEWKNNKKAYKLMEMVAEKLGKTVDQCYADFGNKLAEKYGTLYTAFDEATYDIQTLKKDGFEGDWLTAFEEVAKLNITIPYVEIKGYIKTTSWLPEGIHHLKKVLGDAEKSEYEDVDIKVKCIGAPQYIIKITAPDYKIAEEHLKKAVEKMERLIKENNGDFEFHRKLDD
jgi:translation initiation factor 2 subunit 1